MKTLVICIGILFALPFLIFAQGNISLRLFTDPNYIPSDKEDQTKMIAYFDKLIKAGKLASYSEGFINAKKQDRPLSIAEYEALFVPDSYLDTLVVVDPISSAEKMSVTKITINRTINKVRFTSDLQFDEKSQKLNTQIKQINFLREIKSSEGIFVGYSTLFYVKF